MKALCPTNGLHSNQHKLVANQESHSRYIAICAGKTYAAVDKVSKPGNSILEIVVSHLHDSANMLQDAQVRRLLKF